MRKLLFPLSLLYSGIIASRNFLYDKRVFKSFQFDVLTIGIGNLSVGGTGKSPHVEFLIELLCKKYKIATLSRGYGRKTKGFILGDNNSKPVEIGDEPAAFKLKYPHVPVAVCENRVLGVTELMAQEPETELIILDDVFQHRAILPHIQILITSFDNLFYKDFVLPAGDLREARCGAARADIIVVSKCPLELSLESQSDIIMRIREYNSTARIEFSSIFYASLTNVFTGDVNIIEKGSNILAFTGIAKPDLFFNELSRQFVIDRKQFSDHYNYSVADLESMKVRHQSSLWICTEKDAVKLRQFKTWFEKAQIKLYYLPIAVKFLGPTFETNLDLKITAAETLILEG